MVPVVERCGFGCKPNLNVAYYYICTGVHCKKGGGGKYSRYLISKGSPVLAKKDKLHLPRVHVRLTQAMPL